MATSNNQSGFVDNWQNGKSVTECNLYMLETEDFTDVTFLVGSKKHVVRAHRFVLASRSCVFHAMFSGRMMEEREITIPDIEANVFKDFLRFLYTDTCTITSGNVSGLLYTSRKYDVETLFSQSASFLENSLSEENVCEILEKSHGYGETDLEQKALKILSKAGPKVIKSVGFNDLCSECFGTFLETSTVNIKEEEIFEAALSWTNAECVREGLTPSHENMRKVLGEMVYEIRFANLSLEYLAMVVGPSEMLTVDERIKIMDRLLGLSNDISPFQVVARGDRKTVKPKPSPSVFYAERFRTIREPSRQVRRHAISFSTNKNISLLGCQLYGSGTTEIIRTDIQLSDHQGYLISHPIKDTAMTLNKTVNDMIFPYPSTIAAGHVYTISVVYSIYSNLYSGSEGAAKVSAGGVEFTFIKPAMAWFTTSIEEGQIPGLIWGKYILHLTESYRSKSLNHDCNLNRESTI